MSRFIYLAKNRPCPLCHGVDDCRESLTTGLIHCRHTSRDYPPPGFVFIKDDLQGFGMFATVDGMIANDESAARRLRVAEYLNSGKPSDRRKNSDAKSTTTFANISAEMRPLTDQQRTWLAATLFVAPAAIDAIGYATWHDRRNELQFTTPEWNGAGAIVGRSTRDQVGKKRTHGRGGPGPDRGLFIPRDDAWQPRPGEPLLVVEGATDTLAWLTMGRGAIGRPSNVGGIEYLADFLAAQHYAGPVLIVGENDRKDTGAWPGLTGAEQSAIKLSKLYAGPVAYALPPAGVKDTRDYLRACIADNGNTLTSFEAEEFGSDLLFHLTAASVHVHRITNPSAASHDHAAGSSETSSAVSTTPAAAPAISPITDRWYLHTPHLPPDTPIPPRPRCEHPRGIYMSHIDRLLDRLTWHDCRLLTCAGCGLKRRETWRRAIRRHLAKFAADNPDTPIYLYHVELGKQWNTVHAFLRGGNFFRINLNGDGYCIVASVNPPGPQILDPQIITPAAAIDRLITAVDRIPKLDRSKLVTSSRGWPIEEKRPEVKPQWRRVCSIVCTAADAMAVLRHRHAVIEHVASPENQTWSWFGVQFVRDFGDVDPDHVAKELVLGQVLPESYTAGAYDVWGNSSNVGDTGPPAELLAW